MTHEQFGKADQPKQRLTTLLQADFTSSESKAFAQQAKEDNALASFLAHAVSVEDIDTRFASDENMALGEQVAALVAPAPITDSFKGFIVGEVRRAHAWQTSVDPVVAPDRLGLASGEGIFDPERSREIEEQTIRGRAYDVLRHYTSSSSADSSELPQLGLRPGRRPRDFSAALNQLLTWEADCTQTYGKDPFEDVDKEALLAAAPRATYVEVDKEGDNELSLGNIVRRLQELRDNESRQSDD
ncbi:MAG: hypothetical protein ACRDK4_04055 [Solirubrobacteraceae bacterium]